MQFDPLVIVVVIMLDSSSLIMDKGEQECTDERQYIAKHKHLEVLVIYTFSPSNPLP